VSTPQPAPDALPFADVAVDARVADGPELFTYAIPPGMDVRPGHLVRVPFGNRTLAGVVTERVGASKAGYAKPIAGLVFPAPLISPTGLALARWVAREYRSTLYDALAPLLPPGLRTRSGTRLRLSPNAPAPERLGEGPRRLLAYLHAHPRPHALAALTRTLGPWTANAARALAEAGLVEEEAAVPHPPQPARPVLAVRPLLAPRALRALAASLTRAPKQAALALRLANGALPAAVAREEFGASAVDGLVRRGAAVLEPLAPALATASAAPSLLPTPAQAAALAAINGAQDAQTGQGFLLHGVTGSGKTEVYLQALAHCLGRGRQAIVLVPELSLTPQAVARFEARFPGRVAVLHSGLSPTQAWAAWWRARRGEADVVVGPRSAVFAPLERVGLVVVDEEHEPAYKQADNQPRYHARAVALALGELTGAPVVLGSATPDVVTALAAEHGRLTRLGLEERIERSGAARPRAAVEVVDMRAELRAGNRSVFSGALRAGLEETLAAGQQAILFLNRRGAATVVECRTCGQPVRCTHCGTPFTLHTQEGGTLLLCHHCNRRRGMPRTCPACRSASIRSLGLGTERLASEVAAAFPQARVLRWDHDTAPTVTAHARLLEAFERGEGDVLVGTQMVAKGLDLPGVVLVGAVLADIGLNVPDYRAPERAFQLLTQVAGRAGRASLPGRAIIQTYQPEHYAVQAAAAQDYGAFYQQELLHRRAHGYPPFGRLVRLLFTHTDQRHARQEATRMANALRHAIASWDIAGSDVVGPAPAFPPRGRGGWRWGVLVRGPQPHQVLEQVSMPPGWVVDVDPASTL
jgi:primosomal protein N' (replication factor Y)